jgi:uncharacterized protein with beta-barrel porin domain
MPDLRASRRRSPLLCGLATAALLAGVSGANADGLTFNWSGAGNGTSFSSPANWVSAVDGSVMSAPPSSSDTMNVTTGTPTVTATGWQILSLNLSGGQFLVHSGSVGAPTFTVSGALNLSGTGALDVGMDAQGTSAVNAGTLEMSGGTVAGINAAGVLNITNEVDQSGGVVSQVTSKGAVSLVTINTPTYNLSGGTLAAIVNFSTFNLSASGTVASQAQLTGTAGATMTQSGGSMNGTVTGLTSYTHSGGNLGGTVSTGTYDLTNAAATSTGGSINASNSFTLEPASGVAVVGANLSGTGNLVKTGNSTVVLTGTNIFTGTVAVNAGTLELQGGAALANTAAVTVANTAGATLLVTQSQTIGSLSGGGSAGGTVSIAAGQTLATGDSTNTTFSGTMTGSAGGLTKQGSGTFTLGGDVTLGGLSVNGGELAIGTGTSTNTASFESATIAAGATLLVDSGATLTIRVPDNLVNNGHLINNGTVNDDLANTSTFDNNMVFNANVTSNTGTINNNTPGAWTGNVLTNAATINNNAGATWSGNVITNDGSINNNAGAVWTGDVTNTNGQIANGGQWNGRVLANNNAIFNLSGATWTGDVVANGGQINNHGMWNGAVESNAALITNVAGTWTGAVLANAGSIINNINDPTLNPSGVNHAVWNGDVTNTTGQITNDHGGQWNGRVLGNSGTMANEASATWTGAVVANSGGINNFGTWNGAVQSNAGTIYNFAGTWNGAVLVNAGLIYNNLNDPTLNPSGVNHAVWNGDVTTTTGQVINDQGGQWNGRVIANNNAISNQLGATWTGDVVTNGGGPNNSHTQINNLGTWNGAVESNAAFINNFDGAWNGAVAANTGTIVNNREDDTINPQGINHTAWNGDVMSNSGTILNQSGGIWTGNVLGNIGSIINSGTWIGNVASNTGILTNAQTWTGTVTNNGTFNNSAGATLSGLLTNGGTTNNAGTLSGGLTNIAGITNNTGSIGGVTTVSGGTLTGNGTTGNLVVGNGGAFAPGIGAPGSSMTVNGTVSLSSSATYLVQFNATTASLANVTGTASLAGTLVATGMSLTGGTSGFALQRQYDVLHATGGLASTAFGGFTMFDAVIIQNFTGALNYTSTDVLLSVYAAALGNTSNLNSNQQSQGKAINSFFNNGGTLPAGFANLFGLTGGALGNALTQVSGEAATGAERGAFQLTTQFLDLLLDPWGGSGGGGGAIGFAPEQQASLPPDVALAYASVLKAAPKPNLGQRWNVWGSSFGGTSNTNGNPAVGSNNVTAGTYGVAAGADYRVTPNTLVGLALAGGGTNWSLAQGGLGGGRGDAFQAGLYSKSSVGPAYVSAALTFANQWFNTNRIALGDQLKASFEGQDYAARAEGGYRFALPVSHASLGITPYAALQTQLLHTPGYNETDLTGGGFGLAYSTLNATDTRSELGARFDNLQFVDGMPLMLRARLAWAHDWVSNPALQAVFQALPGSSFIVNGAALPADSALITASAELRLDATWSLLAKFDGEFASNSQTYAGTGTLRASW